MRPGSAMSWPRAVIRQTEPSLAGAFSSAVRSAMSAPGKYPTTMFHRLRATIVSGGSAMFRV